MTTPATRRPHPAGRGALAGLASAGLLLGTASAVAAVVGRGSDPFLAVGDTVVRLSPKPLTTFAITTFGAYDKLVLFVGIGVVVAALAALAGVLATRRLALGLVLPVLLVLAAAAALLLSPGAGALDLVPLLVGTVVAATVFVTLVRLARRGRGGAPSDPAGEDTGPARGAPTSRRLFLTATGATAVVAAGLAGVGRVLGGTLRDGAASRAGLVLPTASNRLPPVPERAQLVEGAPFRTPPADFYRVDTALTVPRLPAEGWTVRVHGLVDTELVLDWDRLTRTFEVVDREVTLVCVSNPVGGDLAGNQVWRGIRLADVLAAAGVDPSADMVLSTSVDGWTASTPLTALVDSDDALLAFGMDGEPLPFEHGFPVRMVVPGLYGYVSATKWVTDLEVTRFADDEAYWTPRGYAAQAPVKTASRIEVPGSFARVAAGPVVVAGTAWHPGLGVQGVEVQVDDGAWQQAELGVVPGPTTWRQWRWEWAAEPGQHTLRVRASAADGTTQTEERAEIAPDGSSGWHSVVVTADET